MRTHIPAHTEIRCDRCSMFIEDEKASTNIVLDPNYSQEVNAGEYDLCPNCMGAFHRFMRNEKDPLLP